jgi:ligand-binding sensor domain-containing protein
VNGLSDDCVLSVCTDLGGNLWAGTQSGTLHRIANGAPACLGKTDGLPGTPITVLLAAHEGGLWIGTGNGVLLRFEPQLGRMAGVHLPPKLSGKPILSLHEGADRNLWVGSAGGGLGCLTTKGCWAWDSQNGLPDDVISGVVEDADGNLWLVTGQGLCRVTRPSVAQALAAGAPLKARLLFETQAGPNRTPNVGWPRALRSPKGRLWFATSSGLVGIDPHGWEAEKPAPRVHLEAVLVDDRPLNLPLTEQARAAQETRPLTLPSGLQALEFQFTALSFEAPEKIRFRHKLERLDADWSETGPERRVKYGRLPSGSYRFHVTACNAEGVWNKTGTSLAFIIPMPLWRAP